MHIVREGEELDELAGEVQEIEDATETLMNALSQLPPELELEGLYSFLYLMSKAREWGATLAAVRFFEEKSGGEAAERT